VPEAASAPFLTPVPDVASSSAESGKDKSETIPPVPTYTIGGTLNGLTGGAIIVVTVNGANEQTLTKNGTFTLSANQPENSSYNLSIVTPPTNQPCTSIYGTGIVNGANNSSINLLCCLMPRDGFAITTKLSTARYYHTTTLLPDGKALVVGGTKNGTTALDTAELYDPVAHTWSVADSLLIARYYHTATPLPDGKVWVMGGLDARGALAKAEL
jgi:hypothetical protein